MPARTWRTCCWFAPRCARGNWRFAPRSAASGGGSSGTDLAEALLLRGYRRSGQEWRWPGSGIHELLSDCAGGFAAPECHYDRSHPCLLFTLACGACLRGDLWHGARVYIASRPGLSSHQLRSQRDATAGLVGGRMRCATAVAVAASGIGICAVHRVRPDVPQLPAPAAREPRVRCEHRLLTFQLTGRGGQPTPEQRAAFQREIQQGLSHPGGVSVGRDCSVPACRGFQPHPLGTRAGSSADPSVNSKQPTSRSCCRAISKPCRCRLHCRPRPSTEAENAPTRNSGDHRSDRLPRRRFPGQVR